MKKKIRFKCGTSTCRYAFFGVAFGICFPVIAISFDVILHLGLALSLSSIILVHRENPIHYVIDTAPLFLGLAFGVAGYYQQKAKSLNISLQRQASNLRSANEQLTKALDDYHAAQDQLVKSEKLASLGQLTAGIAHEIKNPLNFINNFSESSFELLDELSSAASEEDRKELTDMIRGNLDKIHIHGKRANNILQSMMMHSRSGKAEKRESDINQVCSDAADISFHGTSSNIIGFSCDFKKEFSKDLPRIHVVYEDISRVILNLLTNAFYAVNQRKNNGEPEYKATVTLSTKLAPDQMKRKGKRILITIRDNGSGIPESIKEKIFNPFFTTKPSGEGTGLGLSISHDIIVAHGGEMIVDSRENEFTEFRISLPVQ